MKYLIFLLFSLNIFASSEECKFYKYCGDRNSGSGQSMPSQAAASSFNPGAVSKIKGFGIETISQRHNSIIYNFLTGTGKVGALISSTLECSFFSNRALELDGTYKTRYDQHKQYSTEKYLLTLGGQLLSKKNIELELGVSGKYNKQTKVMSPGASLSGRILFLNFSAYFYKDDVLVDLKNEINPYTGVLYSQIYNNSKYTEKFLVQAYTLGTQIGDLSLDWGYLRTKYKFYFEDTKVYLYSTAYSTGAWLLNFAVRREFSPNQKLINDVLKIQRSKTENYWGTQYKLNQHFFVGINYNYFLLRELSLVVTIFI